MTSVYSMVGHFGQQTVLKNINFLDKIGDIGLWLWFRKSILRYGWREQVSGEAHLSEGYTVGYLEQG